MNEITDWFRRKLDLSPTHRSANTTRNTLSFVNGIIGTIWTLPLTYDFGILIAKSLDIEDESTQKYIGYFFMCVSGMSSAFLFARLTDLLSKKLLLLVQHHRP